MDASSTKRNGLSKLHVPAATDSGVTNEVRRPTLLHHLKRTVSTTPGPSQRPSLEELFRTIVREELYPFVRMLHELLERMGRTAHGADELLSVADAAKMVRVGKSTIRGWITSGRLQTRRAGRLVRIRRSDLDAVLTESRQEKRTDPEAEAAKIFERNRPTER